MLVFALVSQKLNFGFYPKMDIEKYKRIEKYYVPEVVL